MSEKHLCKFSKSDYSGKEYRTIVTGTTHVCKKCGRAANSKKRLCGPVAIQKKKEKTASAE